MSVYGCGSRAPTTFQPRSTFTIDGGIDGGSVWRIRIGDTIIALNSKKSLRDLARRRPTHAIGFRQAHGIGDAKLAKFGDRFLAEIRAYCHEHTIESDISGGINPAV